MSNKPKRHQPSQFKSGKTFSLSKPRNARDLGYDKDWDKYRFRFLHHNPQCYCCPNKATVVDHIEAHKGDEFLFKKLDNHLPLCRYCHNEITGRFDRLEVPKTEEKIKWINEKRELFGIKVRVKVLPNYS